MKRGKPLKRTPFKRKPAGRLPLKSSNGVSKKARKPLRARSKKAEDRDRRRAKAKAVVWERAKGRCELASPIAQVDPAARTCAGEWEYHEPKKRSRGGDAADPEEMTLTCSKHHRWTEENVALADEIGALKHSWDPS